MTRRRARSKKERVDRTHFNENGVPTKLRGLRRWVTYDADTKAPFGDVTDPATWLTFADAQRRARINGFGIGFAFAKGDQLCGIDLDNVRNPATAELLPMAREIVRRVASYTEVSPSGRGLHIIARAKLPRDTRHKIVVGASPMVAGATVRLEAY